MCIINCSGGCPECSPEDFTKEEIVKHFSQENKKLKERLATKSWEGYVDRQGGSFSQDEIDNATTWR